MKTKTFDCVDLKRRGAERVQAELEGMTPSQQVGREDGEVDGGQLVHGPGPHYSPKFLLGTGAWTPTARCASRCTGDRPGTIVPGEQQPMERTA